MNKERVEGLFYRAVADWSLRAAPAIIYIVAKFVVGMSRNTVSNPVNDVPLHLSAFALEVIHKITLGESLVVRISTAIVTITVHSVCEKRTTKAALHRLVEGDLA